MIIKRKLKPCKTCTDPKYLFSHGNCLECYNRLKLVSKPTYTHVTLKQTSQQTAKPFRVIKRVSDKRAKLDAIYNIAATQFKKDNPYCMARLPECVSVTSDAHHLYSGSSRSKYYLDFREIITVCVMCHFKIHNVLGKDELIELGLKKIE